MIPEEITFMEVREEVEKIKKILHASIVGIDNSAEAVCKVGAILYFLVVGLARISFDDDEYRFKFIEAFCENLKEGAENEFRDG